MSIKAEVRNLEVITKSGVSKRGKPYSIREQAAMVSLPSGEVRRITLTLDDDAEALPLGQYEPKPSAFYVGGFGELMVSMRAHHWQPAAARPAVVKASA